MKKTVRLIVFIISSLFLVSLVSAEVPVLSRDTIQKNLPVLTIDRNRNMTFYQNITQIINQINQSSNITYYVNTTNNITYYVNTTTYIYNTSSNGTSLFTNINLTQFDNSTGTLNIVVSWVQSLITAYGYITTWLIPDTGNGYLFNDSTNVYFNDSKLNATINSIVASYNITAGSGNVSYTNLAWTNESNIFNGTQTINGHLKLNGANDTYSEIYLDDSGNTIFT